MHTPTPKAKTKGLDDDLKKLFPYLQEDPTRAEVINNKPEEVGSYNCFALVAGDLTRPWWPVPHRTNFNYWPKGYKREETITALSDVLVGMFNYTFCAYKDFETNKERVALFEKINKLGVAEATHVAFQPHNENGIWYSKIGLEDLLRHELWVLEDGLYGVVVKLLERKYSPKNRGPTPLR